VKICLLSYDVTAGCVAVDTARLGIGNLAVSWLISTLDWETVSELRSSTCHWGSCQTRRYTMQRLTCRSSRGLVHADANCRLSKIYALYWFLGTGTKPASDGPYTQHIKIRLASATCAVQEVSRPRNSGSLPMPVAIQASRRYAVRRLGYA
jgi:hypothetical protein